ncbi:hypothetical protein D3Z62_13045 [Lachnospiraceae bacterium]|nr:hypothetical protein [Lachnospiraceae bacterium]
MSPGTLFPGGLSCYTLSITEKQRHTPKACLRETWVRKNRNIPGTLGQGGGKRRCGGIVD